MAYRVPIACPECGHAPITEMISGLIRNPSRALQADLRSGRKQLAGCVVSSNVPAYYCRACQWSRSRKDAEHPLYLARQKFLEERTRKETP